MFYVFQKGNRQPQAAPSGADLDVRLICPVKVRASGGKKPETAGNGGQFFDLQRVVGGVFSQKIRGLKG